MTAVAAVRPRRFENPPAVLTFDLEEWFCVCGDDYYGDVRRWESFESRVEPLVEQLLQALSAGGHRATFFVLGWVGRAHPQLVRGLARAGHEIAFHGMEHRRVVEMSDRSFRDDLQRGRALLEDLSGEKVVGYRAAEWSIHSVTDRALAILADEGFRYDASVTPVPLIGRRDNPLLPVEIDYGGGRSLVEFPPLSGRGWCNTVHFGGGWAFRRLRFQSVMRRADAFRALGAPAIFTFHPWEFDVEHPPMTGLSPLHRLTHFAHSSRLPRKFERLLARERMSALRDLL